MNQLTKKKNELVKLGLCNHCLGRQFAKLGYNLENYQRGNILRGKEIINKDIFEDHSIKKNQFDAGDSCFLCEDIFTEIDLYVDKIIAKLEDFSIETMLVGTSLTKSIKNKEEQLWEEYGAEYSEPLKTELNRLVGKKVLSKLDLKIDFKRPDLVAIIELGKNNIRLQINSMLVYGRYNKYLRGVSQTIWFRDREVVSVEELVSQPFVKASKAERSKFHGAGREDIDVRCFGRREFVVELVKAKNRKIDLSKLKEKVNNQVAVDIFALEETTKDKIQEIKEKRADKTYRALVKLSKPIKSYKLKELDDLIGIIKQRTPDRVDHRRTDMIREREVYAIFYELINDDLFELIVKAEAGTYIKELISGDGGRTEPNVGQMLDCKAVCDKLDVLDIR